MAICHNCGKKIEDDAKFCPACGTAVENSAMEAGSINEKKLSIKQIAVGVLAFVAFIVLIYNSGIACILSAIISLLVMLVSLIVFLVGVFRKKNKKMYGKICIISLAIFIISIFIPTSMPVTLRSSSSANNDSKVSDRKLQ